MTPQALVETPLTPASELGPFRKQDYLRLPDEPRCELIFGRLHATHSPLLWHQVAIVVLARHFDDIARETEGLALVAPMDVTLADHSVVQPDVIYVSPERREILQDRIEGAPDLLVEVLSPSTARLDRSEKLKLYAESDVREYWLLEWPSRQIEFLINRDGRFQVDLALDGVYRSEVLPKVSLDLARFWREVEARLPAESTAPSR